MFDPLKLKYMLPTTIISAIIGSYLGDYLADIQEKRTRAIVQEEMRLYQSESSQVQEGYVHPRDVRIESWDLDGDKNRKTETFFRHKGLDYHLKLDGNGVPFIEPYRVDGKK